MTDHPTLIMFLWGLLTIGFGSGVSWATVKVTLRGVQKDNDKRDAALEVLRQRLTCDEHKYVKVVACEKDRAGCEKEKAYHESVILQRLDELKSGVASVIDEQKAVRKELYDRLDEIGKSIQGQQNHVGQ